jgi:hypothetical protein
VDIGYQFIFSSSLALKAYNKHFTMDQDESSPLIESACQVHVKTSQWIGQMIVILLITAGFVFFFSTNNTKNPSS